MTKRVENEASLPSRENNTCEACCNINTFILHVYWNNPSQHLWWGGEAFMSFYVEGWREWKERLGPYFMEKYLQTKIMWWFGNKKAKCYEFGNAR